MKRVDGSRVKMFPIHGVSNPFYGRVSCRVLALCLFDLRTGFEGVDSSFDFTFILSGIIFLDLDRCGIEATAKVVVVYVHCSPGIHHLSQCIESG